MKWNVCTSAASHVSRKGTLYSTFPNPNITRKRQCTRLASRKLLQRVLLLRTLQAQTQCTQRRAQGAIKDTCGVPRRQTSRLHSSCARQSNDSSRHRRFATTTSGSCNPGASSFYINSSAAVPLASALEVPKPTSVGIAVTWARRWHCECGGPSLPCVTIDHLLARLHDSFVGPCHGRTERRGTRCSLALEHLVSQSDQRERCRERGVRVQLF